MVSGVDDVPACPHFEKEFAWNAGSRRLWIQTDNQLLESALSGRATIDSPEFRPIFVRVCNAFQRLLYMGFLPRLNTTGFVEWDYRAYNCVADHAANVALDMGTAWVKEDACSVRRARHNKANIRLSFDGALRGGRQGLAGAGIAVYSYSEGAGRETLYMGGKLLGTLQSSFLAEALSLEWALEVLFSTILGISEH